MGTCKIKLKLNNGNEMLFRSRKDLNTFLYNNRNRLNLSDAQLYNNNISFSVNFDAQQEALAILADTINLRRSIYGNSASTDIYQLGEKYEGHQQNVFTGTNIHKRYYKGRQLSTPMSVDNFRL